MIRLVNVLRRKAGLSFSEFNELWLNEHGPLVAKHAETLGIKRYVQLHNIAEPEGPTQDALRGEMGVPYDGVAEYWFESMASLLESEKHLKIEDELFSHEQTFINHSESAAWIAYEVPHVNPTPENIIAAPSSSLVRLFYVLTQPANMTIADTQWYWRVQHGPLVRQAAPHIQALRYLQVHTIEDDFNDRIQTRRGLANPYYGHAELWFDLSREPLPEAKPAGVMLYEDETRFIDFSRSAIWYGKEHVLVG